MESILEKLESEKEAYWKMRDSLLQEYRGMWVAIHEGKLVGAGKTRMEAVKAAYKSIGFKPLYTNKVGEEERVSIIVYRS